MTLIAGVDGCKSGWICITRDLATRSVNSVLYPNAKSLIDQTPEPAIIAVDIPIGLSEKGPRLCDIEARKVLGKRKSSVFPAPIRPVIKLQKYEDANVLHKKITGNGISKQTHAICEKILEFDEILSAHVFLQKRIKEIHPEVCFWAWNGQKPMEHNKKTSEGLSVRRSLIVDHFGRETLNMVRGQHFCKDVADDDIHDAFAALWIA